MNTNLQLLVEADVSPAMQINVAYAGTEFKDLVVRDVSPFYNLRLNGSVSSLEKTIQGLSFLELPDAFLLEVDDKGECFSFIENIKKNPTLKDIIIVLLSNKDNIELKARALALKVHDFYTFPFRTVDLNERLKFLIKFRIISPWNSESSITHSQEDISYKIPLSKRLFDIVASALALFFLSPLFVIIAIMIRMESKGPIIYKSKRVGTGYNVFDFYKFRSMRTDADMQLSELSSKNQYDKNEDNIKSVFIKIVNDPRVTKVGNFIRNTSIDELPQLFNILKGDMSFVGNRPLPMYEAEMLTSNEWSMRFLGPAGLTGLWQTSKRGKKDMSEIERKQLDNEYASGHSFLIDLKIILKTFPALIQKEKI